MLCFENTIVKWLYSLFCSKIPSCFLKSIEYFNSFARGAVIVEIT